MGYPGMCEGGQYFEALGGPRLGGTVVHWIMTFCFVFRLTWQMPNAREARIARVNIAGMEK